MIICSDSLKMTPQGVLSIHRCERCSKCLCGVI